MESSLISKLEAGDFRDIHLLFSDFLRPFTKLKCPKNSTKTDDYLLSRRSLEKTFLPFMNRSLAILNKLLADPSNLGSDELLATELFNTCKLCLYCSNIVSAQLSKPYKVHSQRIHMACCLERWRRYNEAEMEGFRILKSIRGGYFESQLAKSEGKILPNVNKSHCDSEIGWLVVETVILLVSCTEKNQSKDWDVCKWILGLVEEVRPWVLDDTVYEKKHKTLLMLMDNCALFLIGELTYF